VRAAGVLAKGRMFDMPALHHHSLGSAHMQQDALSNSCTAAETLYYLIPVLLNNFEDCRLLECDAIDQ